MATGAVPLANAKRNDYAAIARAVGIERVFEIDSLEGLHSQFDKIVLEPGHTFTVLEVEPLRKKPGGVPIDDVESKFASGATSRKRQGSKSSAIRQPSP